MELRKGMPDVGEKVKTQDGIGIVIDSNILENKVKVRLILEERTEDKPEKLSVELYTYYKKDIKRLEPAHKKDNKDIFEDLDEDLLDEIKNLLKE